MIPILIKDFTWSQNPDHVFIVVPVPGVRSATTTITTSPTYLKVHCAPFILELFLRHPVDDAAGEGVVDEPQQQVTFRLRKLDTGLEWTTLETDTLDKGDKQRIRQDAVEVTRQRLQREDQERQKRRFDRKQATVHDQIRLDTEAQERVASVKRAEATRALEGLSRWTKTREEGSGDHNSRNIISATAPLESTANIWREDEVDVEDGAATAAPNNGQRLDGGKVAAEFREGRKEDQEKVESGIVVEKAGTVEEKAVVGIRPTACISVSFTPRVFPTPARESTEAEEQEWLKKQAEARRLCGFVDEDLRPEERNPQWLLDKGLSLMRTESWLGAVSAFSLGIRLAPKMAELFVERAGAHLALKNFHRAVDDASQGLELLTPPVTGNAGDRCKCYARRASAFCALDMWPEARRDLDAALKLEHSPSLSPLLKEVREKVEKAAAASATCAEEED